MILEETAPLLLTFNQQRTLPIDLISSIIRFRLLLSYAVQLLFFSLRKTVSHYTSAHVCVCIYIYIYLFYFFLYFNCIDCDIWRSCSYSSCSIFFDESPSIIPFTIHVELWPGFDASRQPMSPSTRCVVHGQLTTRGPPMLLPIAFSVGARGLDINVMRIRVRMRSIE